VAATKRLRAGPEHGRRDSSMGRRHRAGNEEVLGPAMNEVRRKSMSLAVELGYPTNPHLPLLDEVSFIRSLEEIVGRSLAMNCVAAASYGFDRTKAAAWLERESLLQFLTTDESAFLAGGIGDRHGFARQIEGLFVLTWAVGISPQLDFDAPCPDDLVFQFPNLKAGQGAQEFRTRATLRAVDEIVSALDLVYCLHWAVRDARLRNANAPGKVEEFVIVERRRALEWVLADEPWELISLDT